MAGPSHDARLAARGQNSSIFRIFEDGMDPGTPYPPSRNVATSRRSHTRDSAASPCCGNAQEGASRDSQRHPSRVSGTPLSPTGTRASGAGSARAFRNAESGIASANRAMTLDEFEIWFDKGVTDGLPVVPPTRE